MPMHGLCSLTWLPVSDPFCWACSPGEGRGRSAGRAAARQQRWRRSHGVGVVASILHYPCPACILLLFLLICSFVRSSV